MFFCFRFERDYNKGGMVSYGCVEGVVFTYVLVFCFLSVAVPGSHRSTGLVSVDFAGEHRSCLFGL